MKDAIKEIYKNRKDFILIGLTGKIGAGCTTTANFLIEEKHNLPPIAITEESSDRNRKRFIIRQFYEKNWHPFVKITVSDIITSFMLEHKFKDIESFLESKSIQITDKDKFKDNFKKYRKIFLNVNISKKNDKSYKFFTDTLPDISNNLKQYFQNISYRNYTKAYQVMGDNLRLSGNIIGGNQDFDFIYTLSDRINHVIKIIRAKHKKQGIPSYIVIDAFRNPFEALFFKERYSAFYLIAINSKQEDIYSRLTNNYKMTVDAIEEQDKKENPPDIVDNPKNFISQNIQACIQKSDIHISNNGKYGNDNFHELYGQLIKFISLIQHPGLVTPSLDEKMMQLAYTAKLNSGCLSRQVGAAVTNNDGILVSVGWNSVAQGQTPCLLRNTDELLRGTNSIAYSAYEKSKMFKNGIKKHYPKIDDEVLEGRNRSFCFSEIHNLQTTNKKNLDISCKCDKNQVHTRSLHAEENAFLQIAKFGGQGIQGGTLYSTASPCELCSKKSYQLGIKRIVYIDPYPGIAQDQILKAGESPPIIELYKGAIGVAYSKLYEPILPYKDELKALSKGE